MAQANQVKQDPNILFIIAAIVCLGLFLIATVIAVSFIRTWARAFFSGAGISLADIVGMKLRRTDSNLIVDCRIMSVQAGTPIPTKQIESAHLSGADAILATRAYIDAAKSGKEFTFQELVDANRSEKLAEMLGMKT